MTTNPKNQRATITKKTKAKKEEENFLRLPSMNCTNGFGARKEKNQSTQTAAKLRILYEPHQCSCISVIGHAMK
jgi:hypothetical protein